MDKIDKVEGSKTNKKLKTMVSHSVRLSVVKHMWSKERLKYTGIKYIRE